MKLPKRLRERRDTFVSENVADNDIDGFDMGYNQGVEDLMSEVQGLVLALQNASNELGVTQPGYPAPVGNANEYIKKALSKWREFCEEVEKDEKA